MGSTECGDTTLGNGKTELFSELFGTLKWPIPTVGASSSGEMW